MPFEHIHYKINIILDPDRYECDCYNSDIILLQTKVKKNWSND